MCLLSTWLIPWPHINIDLPESVAQKVKILKVYELKDIAQLFDDETYLYQDSNDLVVPSHSVPVQLDKPSSNKALPTQNSTVISLLDHMWHWPMWVTAFCGLGFALFLREIVSYRTLTRSWREISTRANGLKTLLDQPANNVEIRRLNADEPGMTTGFFRPVIWIDQSIDDEDILKSILTHEMTHIQHHDVAWLWAIGFFQKVFWWNPLVRYLCRRCRDELEFSCDEYSLFSLSPSVYIKSLARLMLVDSSSTSKTYQALSIRGRIDINIQRLRWLKSKKVFSGFHIITLSGFALCGAVICSAFTYDFRFRDFFQSPMGNFQVYQSNNATIEYQLEEKAYFDFMQLVYQQDLDAANDTYLTILEKLKTEPLERRIDGFQALAAYLGDSGQHEKIPEYFDQLFEKRYGWRGLDLPRLMAITYIILERYDDAIELMLKAESIMYRGYVPRLLLAQAYHLKGDYLQSIDVIERTLTKPKLSIYDTFYVTLVKLLGKNAVLVDNPSLVEKARGLLGVSNEYDFSALRFDHHRVPYPYFSHSAINGERVTGFELEAFPLRDRLPTLADEKLQSIFRSAVKLANQGHFEDAETRLSRALVRAQTQESFVLSDKVSILEYLFILNMRLERKQTLIDLSRELVTLNGVSKDIRARAHWALASGRYRYSLGGLEHFSQYESLLEAPTLSSDHEKLERWYARGNPEDVRDALYRVTAFYEQNNMTPDIDTLNRMIAFYDVLGETEKEDKYRRLFAKHYSNALNFTLDKI